MMGEVYDRRAVAEAGFLGDGAFARFLAAFDWAATGIGAIGTWPTELCTAVGLALSADNPAAVWWGPAYRVIPNEAFAPVLTERGCTLGATFDEIWGSDPNSFREQFDAVATNRRGQLWQDARQDMRRDARTVETYWTYSVTPIIGRDGQVLGLYNSSREVTARVLTSRTNALLVGLDDALAATDDIDVQIDAAVELIGRTLGVKRVGLAEIDDQLLTIRRCWEAPDVPDIRGRYPLGTWGAITGELARGVTVVIDDHRTDPRTADPATRARYRAIGLVAGIVVPIIDRGRYAGGVFVQQDSVRAWTQSEVELASAATARLWQAIKRVRAEVALSKSEQRHRLIFEQAEDFIVVIGLDARITSCNPSSARALGYTVDELIRRPLIELLPPGEAERAWPRLRRKLQQGGTTRHEMDVVGRGDRRMRWEVSASLAQGRDGGISGIFVIARDVTERRAFEDRRELLIHELNHRVKNTLSLVQALAHQSFRAGDDAAVAQREFVGRLGTLAAAHDLLTREQWEGVTLGELVTAAAATLARERISAEGPPVRVTPKAAVAVAMALHELGTNAIKYGALSTEAGQVDVRWSCSDDRLRLEWHEHGGPVVHTPKNRGFGVRMIERALASDLDADVRVEFAEAGVRCAIDAPRRGNVL